MLAGWLTALAGALIVGSAWYLNAPDDAWRNPLADAQFTPLTEFEGAEESVAISRDGQFVAFLSDQTGVFDAWIGQIGTGQFNNLTQGRTPGQWNRRTRNISFTPDGSAVLLWVRNDAGVVVQWTVPTLGGPVRPFLDDVGELDWSPDGTRFAYHPAGPGDPIYVTERDEQVGQMIFTAESGLHNHFPVWSPDGRYIYFVHGVAQLQESDIWRIPPTGGEPEQITWALLTSKWVEVMVEATKSLQPLGAYVFDGAGLMLARRTGTCCTVGSRHTTIQRRSPCASHLYSKSSSVSRNCTSVGSSWIVTMTCRSR